MITAFIGFFALAVIAATLAFFSAAIFLGCLMFKNTQALPAAWLLLAAALIAGMCASKIAPFEVLMVFTEQGDTK